MSVTEDELKEAAVAPRVTLEQVNEVIASESYLHPSVAPTLTICVLALKNGFTVTGESACADPANFNLELGKRIAKDNAIKKIWPLLGYELRTKLAQTPTTWLDRLKAEQEELRDRLVKLNAFVMTGAYRALPFCERDALESQRLVMGNYLRILNGRVSRAIKSAEGG